MHKLLFRSALSFIFYLLMSIMVLAEDDIYYLAANETEILESAESNIEVYNGILLPSEALVEWPAVSLFQSEHMQIIGEIYKLGNEMIESGREKELLQWYEIYSNQLPPTERDVIIISATDLIVRKLRQNGSIEFVEQWSALSYSRSAAFRYQAFNIIASTDMGGFGYDFSVLSGLGESELSNLESEYYAKKFKLMSRFFGEKDRTFQLSIARSLGGIKTRESYEHLLAQYELYERSGDEEMMREISEVVEMFDLRGIDIAAESTMVTIENSRRPAGVSAPDTASNEAASNLKINHINQSGGLEVSEGEFPIFRSLLLIMLLIFILCYITIKVRDKA